MQNDGVVARLLERAGAAVEVVSHGGPPVAAAGLQQGGCCGRGGPGPELLAALGAEPTRHGWLVLPDAGGWGPIYLALLRKTAPLGDMRRRAVNKYARS